MAEAKENLDRKVEPNSEIKEVKRERRRKEVTERREKKKELSAKPENKTIRKSNIEVAKRIKMEDTKQNKVKNTKQKNTRGKNESYTKKEKDQNEKTEIQRIPKKTRRNRIKEDVRMKKSPLKIIPLGGLLEIGKNITVFEYENEIVIVDCGLAFPTEDMLGVDLVVADTSYLEKNREKIKGLVITHGHEDHIGGIPYLLRQVNVPIYGTRFTLGLLRNKLDEHRLLKSTKMYEVNQGQTIDFGKIKVEFIRTSHSIPDAVSFAIYTPVGTVVHTGDFKVDYTPIDGQTIDFGRLAEIGEKGVMLLMSDSTNAERKGFTKSESTIGEAFDELFSHCKKRIVVATFASNVHRVQQIINSSEKYGRKVAVCGRSMVKMIETAVELGYMEMPKNIMIDIDMVKNYADENLTIITTGSQGEPMSALTRMAAGEHKKVSITPNDLVIISANPIPGNEKFVSKVIDDLMQIGAEVIYSSLADIHVSGHGCQEEQKLMLSLVKPKYFMPVHGEYRQLIAHAETAEKMGVPHENIFIMKNGRVLEIGESEAKITGSVPSGKIMVDGLGIGDVGNIVLKDRQHLSQDGLIIVVLAMNGSSRRNRIRTRDNFKRICIYKRIWELNGRYEKSIKRKIKRIRRKSYNRLGSYKINNKRYIKGLFITKK